MDAIDQPSGPASPTAARRLDNLTNYSSAPVPSSVRGAQHWWDLLETAKHLSESRHRVRSCACFTVGEHNQAQVIATTSGPRFRGLNRCGAHHVCPRCARAYRAEKAAEIAWLMGENGKRGRKAYFFTGTVPHHEGDPPGPMLEALSKAWNGTFSGRGRAQLQDLGLAGYVRAVDYTVGGHGHHLHLHAILWFDRELTPEELAIQNVGLYGRWSRAVERVLGRPCDRKAFYLEPVSQDMACADYVAKVCGIPYELTSAMTKEGKGRTIWGVLRDLTLARMAGEPLNERDVRIWREYARAIKGKRGIDLSRTMIALLKERPESDGEETTPPRVLATVGRLAYGAIRANRLQGRLLDAFERASPRTCAEADAMLAEAERHATRLDALSYVLAAVLRLERPGT